MYRCVSITCCTTIGIPVSYRLTPPPRGPAIARQLYEPVTPGFLLTMLFPAKRAVQPNPILTHPVYCSQFSAVELKLLTLLHKPAKKEPVTSPKPVPLGPVAASNANLKYK